MALPKYKSADDLIQILRKLLQCVGGTQSGDAGLIEVLLTLSGGGSPVTTIGNVTIAAAATAQLAIPSGQAGFISAPSDMTGSVFVGGSNVTNASGGFRGIELIAGGISPKLAGPVWVAASANGLVVGVVSA